MLHATLNKLNPLWRFPKCLFCRLLNRWPRTSASCSARLRFRRRWMRHLPVVRCRNRSRQVGTRAKLTTMTLPGARGQLSDGVVTRTYKQALGGLWAVAFSTLHLVPLSSIDSEILHRIISSVSDPRLTPAHTRAERPVVVAARPLRETVLRPPSLRPCCAARPSARADLSGRPRLCRRDC